MSYYCFRGQNETVGLPHPQTAKKSNLGKVLAFSTEEKRNRYVAEYEDNDPENVFVKACNKKTARDYCMGMSVKVYESYLESLVDDVEYNEYFMITKDDSANPESHYREEAKGSVYRQIGEDPDYYFVGYLDGMTLDEFIASAENEK